MPDPRWPLPELCRAALHIPPEDNCIDRNFCPPSRGKGQFKILISMCVQCLPCPKAPAGSSMAVPSPGWWEQAPHQHPLPGRRLSVALLCNCRWLLDRSRLHMVFNLSFYTCPIRGGGRRRRGGDRRWRRLG